MRDPILISACLLGMPCRYDGCSKPLPQLVSLLTRRLIIPVCPEIRGGLKVPHSPAEIGEGDGESVLEGKARVISKDGDDYTEPFIKGAAGVLQIAKDLNPGLIVLKSNSPSCGLREIYDGSFTGTLKTGRGVTATLLAQAGFQLCDENEFLKILPQILAEDNS